MKKIIFLLIIFSYKAYCQDTLISYYDHNWKDITNKDLASFYRKAFKNNDASFTVWDYYIDGKIQMKGVYKNKKFKEKHGHFIYYFENGKISSEGNFIDNKSEGVWNTWYENGQKESETFYKNGLLEGVSQYWYENGQLKYKISSIANRAEGSCIYWFESGEKKAEGVFSNGEKEGDWKYFFKNGEISAKEIFKKGKSISLSEYYNNGVLKSEGIYIDNKPSGTWTYWNVDGRIILKGNFLNGLRVGEWTRFFENGEKMKLTFENGMMIGRQVGGIIVNE